MHHGGARLPRRNGDIARAFTIRGLMLSHSGPADVNPRGAVDHALDAAAGGANRLAVANVAVSNIETQALKWPRIRTAASEYAHGLSSLEDRAHDIIAH